MLAHLSGSMDKPTFVLQAFSPDWRWGLDRTDSLWYPSITNIRQPKLEDWESVFKQVEGIVNSLK
jgi:hypothetical protein